jgi:murein L,D-transpeptidase YafK
MEDSGRALKSIFTSIIKRGGWRIFIARAVALAGLSLVAATTVASEGSNLKSSSGANNIIVAKADISRFQTAPDALIGKTLEDIRANRLDDALLEVNRVIAMHPDFKLAHLIKGDLLTARSRPLAGIGAGSSKARDPQSLPDLRDEARVRLMHFIDQPDQSLLPRQILKLASHQQYALLADASRARLYLFENVDGEPRLKRDYYMTIGRNGTDKRVEGDRRTPIGVYHITSQLPRDKLADLYGTGAFPLNYPNAWDKLQGRGGYGIWLHGVPSNTYSRPPRSSEGCVVVTNPDLDELSQWIQVGITPVVIVDRAEWVNRDEWVASRDALENELAQWQTRWQQKDVDGFLSHYDASFLQERNWASSKRRNIENKEWIKLNVRDASLFIYPGGDMAYGEFLQDYESDRFHSTSLKRMYWKKHDGQWRIALEISDKAPNSQVAARQTGRANLTSNVTRNVTSNLTSQ